MSKVTDDWSGDRGWLLGTFPELKGIGPDRHEHVHHDGCFYAHEHKRGREPHDHVYECPNNPHGPARVSECGPVPAGSGRWEDKGEEETTVPEWRMCEDRQGRGECRSPARFRVERAGRKTDGQDSCARHLPRTVEALAEGQQVAITVTMIGQEDSGRAGGQ